MHFPNPGTVYCPYVATLVIKRKYTTGNSYQYWPLLQIHHKCTVRPYSTPILADSRLTLFFLHSQPVLFSSFIALRTAYGVVPIWVSWYVVAVITWDLGNNFWTEMAEWRYLLLLVFVYLWVHMMHTVLRFVFDTGLKWLIIGRRTPGLYPWDKSSYCLRWKIFESLCADSLHDLRFLGGSAFLPFFYNNMGSKIGRRVCLYPTGADPPMVEPDLVVIEDGA